MVAPSSKVLLPLDLPPPKLGESVGTVPELVFVTSIRDKTAYMAVGVVTLELL
jgi:hypothetical protein